MLYIILFLHQTTTRRNRPCNSRRLYIILFLHQTTTWECLQVATSPLYIILFLHQTTTQAWAPCRALGCISSFSYTKPQLLASCTLPWMVVYHPFPTSNHNLLNERVAEVLLYIILFLHQTTTSIDFLYTVHSLYIILFLHQTTTVMLLTNSIACCISSFSYIKPQRCEDV